MPLPGGGRLPATASLQTYVSACVAMQIVRIRNTLSGGSPQDAPAGRGAAANYGKPADVWAVGILTYELLIGGPAFEADTK